METNERDLVRQRTEAAFDWKARELSAQFHAAYRHLRPADYDRAFLRFQMDMAAARVQCLAEMDAYYLARQGDGQQA